MTHLAILGTWELIILLTIFIVIIPTGIAVIDIVKSEFKENSKIVWILVVFFFILIGPILYFIIGKKQKLKK